MLIIALLVSVALAAEAPRSTQEAPVNPYLLRNYTVCPGYWTSRGFVPCSGQGDCNNMTGECSCMSNFRGFDCSYALRSRRTAFILSFLLGTWGAGQLYLGLIGTGVLQLLAFTTLLVLPCFPLCCMCVASDSAKLRRLYRFVVAACVIGMVGVLLLWTADWVTILLDGTDAYGLSLQDDLKVELAGRAILYK